MKFISNEVGGEYRSDKGHGKGKTTTLNGKIET